MARRSPQPDGAIKLQVTEVKGENIHTKVTVGGKLATRKGINIRGIHGAIPFDFERDISLLNIAIDCGISYVGLSFVRKVEHVRRIRAQLVGTGVGVVAKVETAEAVRYLDEILADADIIMVDRGDLEAEIGKEHVPLTQKRVIRRANELGVPVIIASQFLTSMLDKSLPFMAEVSDVANAVLDGANILMLSEETAIGDYPVECIDTMATVARTVEQHLDKNLHAVVMAAGPSTGFGSLTTNKHKCMLDVGGSTVISHITENLQLAGIDSSETTVAVGHNHQQIEHYLRAEGYHGSFVYNPWFQTTNMTTSLWLCGYRDRNLIIVYGDIVFEPSILEDLIATEGDVVLAVDVRKNLDEEDEKVVIEDGLVTKASKEISLKEADGEFIGLVKLSRRGSRKLYKELDSMARDGLTGAFLSEAFERMAAKGLEIRCCRTKGRAWNDNDTLVDLAETREKIYPRIRDARATGKRGAKSKASK